MRYCDLTFAYTPTSGGIRTYIDQKRQYILTRTEDEHLLIVPGEEEHIEWKGRLLKWTLPGTIIPGAAPYRMFKGISRIEEVLAQLEPDVIELGSYFLSQRAAFAHREKMRAAGKRCLVAGYFHTDVAEAYVGAPLRQALGEGLASWSETLAGWGLRLGKAAEHSAEEYFGSIFNRCDLTFAATEPQGRRLAEYGVNDPCIVPLGVDLENFHPRRRSESLRERFGAGAADTILVYAGRLDSEKQPDVIVDAFEALEREDFHLVMLGEGPLKEDLEERAERLPRFHLLPFEQDKSVFATLLASCDIYVSAGPHETFGLSIVEAESAGLPVVGVAAGALLERVPPQVGRLGPVGDAKAMATHILEVREQRASMGRAARQFVVDQGFGWENALRRLFECYHQASSEPPREFPARKSRKSGGTTLLTGGAGAE